MGFSAQAVQAVIPEAVRPARNGYLQFEADPVLWALVNAVKELKASASLEARLAAIEAALARR